MPNKILMTAALCTLATPALAADPIAQPQVPETDYQAPATNTGSAWAGPYVGGALGYAWSDIEASDGSDDPEADGYFGTAFAGYNMDMDGVVFGVEGDVSAGHIQGSNGESGGSLDPIEQRFEGTLRGQIGADIEGFMPYLTGGLAVANFQVDDGGDTASHTSVGYTVGGGLEAKLTENVAARAEYRFSDYGTQNLDFGSGNTQEIETQTHAVRVGLSYQF